MRSSACVAVSAAAEDLTDALDLDVGARPRRSMRVTSGRNSLVWNAVQGLSVCTSRYCLSSAIVCSQSFCAPKPMRPLEFSESISSMSTLSWSSCEARLRSGFTFMVASTAASGFFFASSHERTVALTKRRTRSALFLMVASCGEDRHADDVGAVVGVAQRGRLLALVLDQEVLIVGAAEQRIDALLQHRHDLGGRIDLHEVDLAHVELVVRRQRAEQLAERIARRDREASCPRGPSAS